MEDPFFLRGQPIDGGCSAICSFVWIKTSPAERLPSPVMYSEGPSAHQAGGPLGIFMLHVCLLGNESTHVSPDSLMISNFWGTGLIPFGIRSVVFESILVSAPCTPPPSFKQSLPTSILGGLSSRFYMPSHPSTWNPDVRDPVLFTTRTPRKVRFHVNWWERIYPSDFER